MRYILTLFLLLSHLLPGGDAQGADLNVHPKLYYQHYRTGVSLYEQGDQAGARTALLNALFLNPEHGETNYYLGLLAHGESNYSAAIAFLNRAREQMPTHVQLLYWLGQSYWSKSLGDEAIDAYRTAVEADPEEQDPFSLYALENLAEVYTRTEKLGESLAAYQQALLREARPEWIAKIRNQIAELHLTMGTYEDDGNTRYNERGEVIGGVGDGDMRTNHYFEIARHSIDPAKESRYYRKAVEADPGMYQSYFNLGWALTRLGRFADAIEPLQQSDQIWRQDHQWNPEGLPKSDAHAFLALAYVELGEPAKALDLAEVALQIDPNYYYGLLYKARALTRLGRAEEAMPMLEDLVQVNPDEPELLYALYDAYRAANSPDGARAALTQAVHSQVDRYKRTRWAEELAAFDTAVNVSSTSQ